MLIVHLIVLFISFYVLAVLTEEFFVPSLDEISKKLKLSSEAAGATLMAVGSSAPEFFTSLFAVFRTDGMADIGAGTIVGSAIFNILVIVGASALYRRAHLTWHVALRDIGFYILSILALLFAFYDGKVVLSEAFFFVALYVVYVSTAIKWKNWFTIFEPESEIDEIGNAVTHNPMSRMLVSAMRIVIPHPDKKPKFYLITFFFSIIFIAFLSHALVESAIGIAEILHISPAIVALTILAGGTSIPDLISSMLVARQGRGDMAISNAVGSNIFDILFALGFPWLLVISLRGTDIVVGTENLFSSIILLFATVIALLFILITRKWNIGKRSGLILIFTYVAYVVYNILQVV